MVLTRERKVLVAILGLAGVVLMADRLFVGMSGPQTASAQTATQAPAQGASQMSGGPTTPSRPESATKAQGSRAAQSEVAQPGQLAELLKEFAGQSEAGTSLAADLFTPQLSTPAQPALTASPTLSDGNTVAENRPAVLPVFRLTAVIATGNTRAAVVNGRTLRVGSQLQGATLAAIEPDCATFQLGEHSWVVMLRQ